MKPIPDQRIPDSLHDEFGGAIAGFFGNRVNDPETVKDLTQEVFLKVYRQLHDGKPLIRDPRAWIHSIARNALYDHYRRRPRQPVSDADQLAEEPPRSRDAREIEERLHQVVQTFIERLPEPYRDAVHLSDIREIDLREVARLQGISLPNAKARVQRGRAKLKSLLLECCEFELSRNGAVLDYRRRQADCCR